MQTEGDFLYNILLMWIFLKIIFSQASRCNCSMLESCVFIAHFFFLIYFALVVDVKRKLIIALYSS